MSPAGSPNDRRLYHFDDFVVDPLRRILLCRGEAVAVTPKTFSLLLALLERRGEVVTKPEILEKVWPDAFVTEANLTQNISSLRRALGDRGGGGHRYIQTVPGHGYRFAGEVREVVADDAMGEAVQGGVPPAALRVSGEPPHPVSAAPVPAPPEPSRPPPEERRQADRGLAAAVSLLLAVSVALAAGLWWLGRRAPAPAAGAGPLAGPAARAAAERLYQAALARLRASDPLAAQDALGRAAQLDPGSALIHSALSQAWAELGNDTRAVAEARRALDLAAALPREQRLELDGRLDAALRRWSRAAETYGSLWTFFPDNLEYGLRLVSSLQQAGRGAEALPVIAALRQLPPAAADPRLDLQEAWLACRLADRATLARAAAAALAKGKTSGQRLVVGQALLLAGSVPLHAGRPGDSVAPFREARNLFAGAGYRWGVALAATHIGWALACSGDLAGAESAHREALAIAQSLGNVGGTAAALAELGMIAESRGDLPHAVTELERSLALLAGAEDPYVQARALAALAAVRLRQGDLDGARQGAETLLTLSGRTGDLAGEAQGYATLAAVVARRGALAQADGYSDRALAALTRVGDPVLASPIVAESVDVLTRRGRLPAARARAEQALEAARTAGDPLGTARVLGALADVLLHMGDVAPARARAEEQLRIARRVGSRELAAAALHRLGSAALAAGELAASRKALQESLAASVQLGDALLALAVEMDLARAELAQGDPAAAQQRARKLGEQCAARGLRGEEARALALHAFALYRRGLTAAAQASAERARVQVEQLDEMDLRYETAPWLARVDAAGQGSRAWTDLRMVGGEAARHGCVPASLAARVMAAELELEQTAGGRALADLAAVAFEARSRGLGLLAGQAEGLAAAHRNRRAS
jgi:DNA-binding winged helix-turn-helix (wHTH) protein/tetratricopeptide (TPR) repeat protein